MFFGRSEEHQKFVAEVKLNWNSTERSPQNQIRAPDQLYSELNLRPPDCNRTTPKVVVLELLAPDQSGALRDDAFIKHSNSACVYDPYTIPARYI